MCSRIQCHQFGSLTTKSFRFFHHRIAYFYCRRWSIQHFGTTIGSSQESCRLRSPIIFITITCIKFRPFIQRIFHDILNTFNRSSILSWCSIFSNYSINNTFSSGEVLSNTTCRSYGSLFWNSNDWYQGFQVFLSSLIINFKRNGTLCIINNRCYCYNFVINSKIGYFSLRVFTSWQFSTFIIDLNFHSAFYIYINNHIYSILTNCTQNGCIAWSHNKT